MYFFRYFYRKSESNYVVINSIYIICNCCVCTIYMFMVFFHYIKRYLNVLTQLWLKKQIRCYVHQSLVLEVEFAKECCSYIQVMCLFM